MMIDAVMYGMIPRKKMATFGDRATEKRSRKPTTPPLLSALCCSCLIAPKSTYGTGRWAPSR